MASVRVRVGEGVGPAMEALDALDTLEARAKKGAEEWMSAGGGTHDLRC